MNRDKTKWTLWWTSTDRQASMWGGNFDTEAEAKAAIEPTATEFRNQCGVGEEYDEGTWSIEPPDND